MRKVATDAHTGNRSFRMIVDAFLQADGLPFSKVLSVDRIARAFAEEDALFGMEDVYSTVLVLWAFLAQVLRDGKGAACRAAVADIRTYRIENGQVPPTSDTGDYCRARAKLSETALRRLTVETAGELQRQADDEWLFKGRHAKLVDGFTFTMPDTPQNQHEYPQNPAQDEGLGLPIARACAILSLATASVPDLAIGPYCGKETGESALLRQMLDTLNQGDIAVFDRCCCSFMMIALLMGRGVDVCTRLHQRRPTDFRRGRRIGEGDHLIEWHKPQRPKWMSPETYATIPETITLREIRVDVTEEGRRVDTLIIITTLVDPNEFSKDDIADLYGFRWNVELDIRSIKQSLNLDHVRCKSPAMVHQELWTTLLGYNLIRATSTIAAKLHQKQPRQISFTGACQVVLSTWMLLSTGACRDAALLCRAMLDQIASSQVADRPGRVEPRVIKRRRHRYPLMQRPRSELRQELQNANAPP